MDKLVVPAMYVLRVVLVVLMVCSVFIQVALLWVLISGSDPEDGSASLTANRIIVIVGLVAVQFGLVAVWQLLAMVRADTVFSAGAFRPVDRLIGAIVSVALAWFAVTAVNAPDQRDDPGVTGIMAGIGLGILGIALVAVVLRGLLAQAIALDSEATKLRARLTGASDAEGL